MDALWFKLRSIEQVQAEGWQHPLGYLSSHLLLGVVEGCAQAAVAGSRQAIPAGSVFAGLPGQLLSVLPDGGSELFVIHFDVIQDGAAQAEGWRSDESDGRLPLEGSLALSAAEGAWMLCRKMAREWQSGMKGGRLRAQAALYELLGAVREEFDAEKPDADTALARTLVYMEEHFDQNMTIDELAEMAGLSRYYYMRLFKTRYGTSVMDYLTELRMNRAKLLLEQSRPKLREIARQVGYQDEFYFIRKFKQRMGIPPATYIRNRRRKVAAYSFPNIGQLLALQVVPFAAPMDHAWTDQYRRKYRTDVVTTLSHEYEFNLATLREARPDYIIGVDAFLPLQEQERIREIAPSLFVPWMKDDWRGHLRLIADFLDTPEEADAWLGQYDRLAVRIGEQVRRLIGRDKVLVVQRNREGYHVYGCKTVAGVLYEDLGIGQPERVKRIQNRETVSLEQLVQFQADRIWLMLPGSEDLRAAWDELARSEAWQAEAAPLTSCVTPIATWPWFDYSAYAQQLFLQSVPAILGMSASGRLSPHHYP